MLWLYHAIGLKNSGGAGILSNERGVESSTGAACVRFYNFRIFCDEARDVAAEHGGEASAVFVGVGYDPFFQSDRREWCGVLFEGFPFFR